MTRTRKHKEHWENGRHLVPWHDGWGNFIGWIDITGHEIED